MPVELNIVEAVTELDTTVVEVNLVSASEPGPAGPGVPTGGTVGQVLTKDSGTDYDTSWQDATGGGGGGAPTDATYLVTTANGDLSAEVVVGATPGGELGGTWASPTVDATHSGSSHASVQAAAEATAAAALLAHTTDSDDAHDASAISIADAGGDFTATDVEGALAELQADHETDATALTDHAADTTSVHGIADTSALALTANHPSNATFEDHSARHENGGADEISLAGLDGTPSALQTHLDDTAGAHAATAVSFTPAGTIAATTVQAAIEEVASEASGVATPPFLGILGASSVAIGATDVYLFKCWVPTAFTVNSIAFRVHSQNGNMQVGIYSSAGAEMYDSGSFAVPAVGARAHTTSSPVALSAGWVYVAIQTSGTASFSITSAGIGVGFSFANTYASGLPATLPALTNLTTPVCLTLHP